MELRGEIDRIDREIVRLFEQRMAVTDEVGRYKIENGKKVFDREREREKIETVKSLVEGDFNRHAVEELFEQIMSMSRKKQYAMLAEKGAGGRLPFIGVDELELENIRVVFQGVEGAYSHAAMCRFFGEDVNSFHVRSFRDAMEAIAEGAADYAVLPLENSTAGIVTDIFDLLVDFENYIVAEQIIPVEHVLMAAKCSSPEQIRKVYSHPQALAQGGSLFARHRNWEAVAYGNTALAAKKIATDQAADEAAIGSAFAAGLFGLQVLQEHVNDQEANSTRFMIVTNQRIFRKDAGKITICFELPHSSGTLYHILSHFIFNNVNMTHIESRPLPGRNWEYRFFIDFEGNLNDASVKNALRGIREEAISMKILGNY
jgi:chorismate mutase/prephenate dehydratase